MTNHKDFRAGLFGLEPKSPDQLYRGYTSGEVWNGWACPYFEFAVAEQILAEIQKSGSYLYSYDAKQDAFIVSSLDSQESDVFGAVQIVVNGVPKKVYGIGTGYWTWDQFPENPGELKALFDTPEHKSQSRAGLFTIKSKWFNERPSDLDAFSGTYFDIPHTALHEDIGLRCYFKAATTKTRFTIVDVQKTYDGSLAYRVMADDDYHKFGCPARPDEIAFVNNDKTYKAVFNDSDRPSFSYFDNIDDAEEWILSQYSSNGHILKRPRNGEVRSFSGDWLDLEDIKRGVKASIIKVEGEN